MGSVLSSWRVSLQRTRADWPIVAAAGLITLLAAVLLAAGPMYASAAAEAGLRRSLVDTAVVDANVHVSLYTQAAEVEAVDEAVTAELRPVVEPAGGTILREWRGNQTLAMPEIGTAAEGDQALIGYLEDLATNARLVDGAWPGERASGASPVEVVLLDTVAEALAVRPGDSLTLVARPGSEAVDVPVRVVGIMALEGDGGAYWHADEQLLAGIRDNGRYQTFGPFFTTSENLVRNVGLQSVQLRWSTFSSYEAMSADAAVRLRNALVGLPERIGVAAGVPVQVATALPGLLQDAERSLLVSRTGVLLLMAQLAVLAAYAIVLTASLLVEHRRIDTALLRSRGASARDVARLALVEGLAIAVPVVLVAPWLALAALSMLNVAGPLADSGLRLAPVVSLDAYVAAAAAGVVGVALLVLPATLAARAFAAERGGLSRHLTRTVGQRLGLDIALLAVTGIALWQLRLYGAPLTRTVQGSLGLDPLLVAAPAIGLLAGGVVALRILPLLAEGMEAAVSRGSGLVAALGSRQLARRPLRYTRSALLLMLAVSMGVFALSYGTTWSDSQRDQAAYQAGADVRVVASTRSSVPAWAVASSYAGLPGVEHAAPVERLSQGVAFTGARSTEVLAIDAESSAAIVRLRGDETGEPFDALLATLRAARPAPELAAVPAGAVYLRIRPTLDRRTLAQLTFDPETGEGPPEPVLREDVRLRASALILGGAGVVHRVESELLSMDLWADGLRVPLAPADGRGSAAVAELGAAFDGDSRLLELGLELWLPTGPFSVQGQVGFAGVWASAEPDRGWVPLQLEPTGPWAALEARGGSALQAISGQVTGTAATFDGGPSSFLFGEGGRRPSMRISFLPASIAGWDEPVPVLANRTFAESIDAVPGDTVTGTVEGARRRFLIAGVVETFPTTDPAKPLLILDQQTLVMLRLQGSGATTPAGEWWLATADGQGAALAEAIDAGPLEPRQVVSVESRERALRSDAVALGIVGALSLGAVATGLFAIVGLTVSTAVSARQRRVEFALLRALGLSGRQLSGSLWLENASLVLVSLLAGTGLGLVIGWLVLPFVTVTQRATSPIPEVLVHVPWEQVLALNAISAAALGVAVIVIGRLLRRLGMGSVLRMGED